MTGDGEAAGRRVPHVFVSYAREDASARDKLATKLKALQKAGKLTYWVDTELNERPRAFGPAIQAELERADIFVALVSDAWLASDYVMDHEAPFLDREGMKSVCFLLSGSTWKQSPWFKRHHLLLTDDVTEHGGLHYRRELGAERAWDMVVTAIVNHATAMDTAASAAASIPPVLDSAPTGADPPEAPGPVPVSSVGAARPPQWSIADWARRHGAWAFVVAGVLLGLPLASGVWIRPMNPSQEPPPDIDASDAADPSGCDADRDPHCRRCGARSPQEFIDGVARLAAQNGQADATTYDYPDKYWLYDPSLPSGRRWTSARYRRDLRLAGASTAPPPGHAWVFVRIPAGEFCMGGPDGTQAPPHDTNRAPEPRESGLNDDERPLHRVRITHDFLIAETETTRAQWEAVGARAEQLRFAGDDMAAVAHTVDWDESAAACALLEAPPIATGVGLPSEAMWEYAARAGTTTRFAFGDDFALLGDYAWHHAISGDTAHAAARTPRTAPLGLSDVHGNLLEWVADAYDYGAYAARTSNGGSVGAGVTVDPLVPAGRDSFVRVVRGGSWFHLPWDLRSAFRYRFRPESRHGFLGFRCASSPPRAAVVP